MNSSYRNEFYCNTWDFNVPVLLPHLLCLRSWKYRPNFMGGGVESRYQCISIIKLPFIPIRLFKKVPSLGGSQVRCINNQIDV